MKKLVIVLTIYSISVIAQNKPEKVVSIVQEEHPTDWYVNQAKLWKEDLKKNPKNENGWLYYYTALRMVWILNGNNNPDRLLMNEGLKSMSKSIPNSFMYNYLYAWDLGSTDEPEKSYPFLEKAYELAPNNVMIFDELISKYEFDQNLEKRKEINQKWFESGTFSTGILNYNYNVLASLAPNAILFTYGDNDTYPIWMIQDALNFRKDVICINTSMFKVKNYREKILKNLLIELSNAEIEIMGNIEKENWEENMVKIMATKSKSNPIYFGLTAGDKNYLNQMGSNIYVIGLSFLYSEKKVDNLALLRDNFENKYLLDYLQAPLYYESSKTIIPYFNQNYIAPLIMLYNHYKSSGDQSKLPKIKFILEKIAKEGDRLEEVKYLIK